MANLALIRTEIDTDPLTRGYSGMNDQAVSDSLNTADRSVNRAELTGDELFTATDDTEFAALTDVKKQLWVSWCNTGRDPFNAANVNYVTWVFGGGATTISNLQSIRTQTVTRAVELGLGLVRAGTVAQARAL